MTTARQVYWGNQMNLSTMPVRVHMFVESIAILAWTSISDVRIYMSYVCVCVAFLY